MNTKELEFLCKIIEKQCEQKAEMEELEFEYGERISRITREHKEEMSKLSELYKSSVEAHESAMLLMKSMENKINGYNKELSVVEAGREELTTYLNELVDIFYNDSPSGDYRSNVDRALSVLDSYKKSMGLK